MNTTLAQEPIGKLKQPQPAFRTEDATDHKAWVAKAPDKPVTFENIHLGSIAAEDVEIAVVADASSDIGDLVMKAIVICDSMACADEVSSTLLHVSSRAEVNIDWTVGRWQANALKETSSAEKALVRARDAHLIVLPAPLAESIPFWILRWLERWVVMRRIPEPALAIIDQENSTQVETPVHPELLEFLRKHGLAFITKEPLFTKEPLKLSVHFGREQLLALPVEPLSLSDSNQPASCRCFGINE